MNLMKSSYLREYSKRKFKGAAQRYVQMKRWFQTGIKPDEATFLRILPMKVLPDGVKCSISKENCWNALLFYPDEQE